MENKQQLIENIANAVAQTVSEYHGDLKMTNKDGGLLCLQVVLETGFGDRHLALWVTGEGETRKWIPKDGKWVRQEIRDVQMP